MFEVHRLNDAGLAKADVLQAAFQAFMHNLEQVCGAEGREMAIVRTKLEEASFFAKRAMAVRPENQLNGVT